LQLQFLPTKKKELDLVEPPEDAQPGERVYCEGVEGVMEPDITSKRWTRIQSFLNTDKDGNPRYKDHILRISTGYCKVTNIKEGVIS